MAYAQVDDEDMKLINSFIDKLNSANDIASLEQLDKAAIKDGEFTRLMDALRTMRCEQLNAKERYIIAPYANLHALQRGLEMYPPQTTHHAPAPVAPAPAPAPAPTPAPAPAVERDFTVQIAANTSGPSFIHVKRIYQEDSTARTETIPYDLKEFMKLATKRMERAQGDRDELQHLFQSINMAYNHISQQNVSDKLRYEMSQLLQNVKAAQHQCHSTTEAKPASHYYERSGNADPKKRAEANISEAAARLRPGLSDHFNQYRYERINGDRKDSIRMSRNPLTLLGRALNIALNGIGALIHTATNGIAEGLRFVVSKIDEKFVQASESGSTLNRIGWGVAKLFISTPLKVASSSIEGVGAVAHGACAMAGGLCRIFIGMEGKEGFRQTAKAGSRMLIDTMQTGINVTQNIGQGIKETGTGLKIPVVSQGMELVGGLVYGSARLLDVVLTGTRAAINGEGGVFGAALGKASQDFVLENSSLLFNCARTVVDGLAWGVMKPMQRIQTAIYGGVEQDGRIKSAVTALETDFNKAIGAALKASNNIPVQNTELDVLMAAQKEADAALTAAKEASTKRQDRSREIMQTKTATPQDRDFEQALKEKARDETKKRVKARIEAARSLRTGTHPI